MDDMGSEDMDSATDCQSTGTCSGEAAALTMKVDVVTPSVFQQSILAAQQFGVIVGVALLVGSFFFLMIAVELGMDWLESKCCKLLGRKNNKEISYF